MNEYIFLRKTGRRADGFERDRGRLYHAVPRREGGYVGDKALCGTQPGLRSDWSESPGDAVTCPTCLRKLHGSQR